MDLKGKSFLKLLDFTPAEIEEFIDTAARFKAEKNIRQILREENISTDTPGS